MAINMIVSLKKSQVLPKIDDETQKKIIELNIWKSLDLRAIFFVKDLHKVGPSQI